MVATCISAVGEYPRLILPYDPAEEVSDQNWVLGVVPSCNNVEKNRYDVTAGRKYMVYAVLIYQNRVYYLIEDDGQMPGFYPSELFETDGWILLEVCRMKAYPVGNDLCVVFGFDELAECYENLRDLIRGTPEMIDHFRNYRMYVD